MEFVFSSCVSSFPILISICFVLISSPLIPNNFSLTHFNAPPISRSCSFEFATISFRFRALNRLSWRPAFCFRLTGSENNEIVSCQFINFDGAILQQPPGLPLVIGLKAAPYLLATADRKLSTFPPDFPFRFIFLVVAIFFILLSSSGRSPLSRCLFLFCFSPLFHCLSSCSFPFFSSFFFPVSSFPQFSRQACTSPQLIDPTPKDRLCLFRLCPSLFLRLFARF